MLFLSFHQGGRYTLFQESYGFSQTQCKALKKKKSQDGSVCVGGSVA